MTFALSIWWTVGWIVGVVVVLLVALLLLAITALARKIDGVAQDLVTDLGSIAVKTGPLPNVSQTNTAVQSITRSLRAARGGEAARNRYSTSPGWRE